jgi:signal transduction histidine kinase
VESMIAASVTGCVEVPIDPRTRDVVQNIYIRKVEKVIGEPWAMEFATFEADDILLSYLRERTQAPFEPQHPDADAVCHDAYRLAETFNNPVSMKAVLAALGQIEFGKGHAREAIALWDRALANDGAELPSRWPAIIYRLRARARAQLGDAVGALRDTNLYVEYLESRRAAQSADEVALLNLKFGAALKDEELARVRAEARAAGLATSRQAFIRDLVATAAVLLVAAALLGMWMWHRRKLAVEAREAAEEGLAALGRLTGGIAHDFNNLLGVLQQAVGLLAHRESVAGDAAATDLVQQARQASQICADITSQLLSFARQQNLQPEALEVDRYLRDVLPLLERAAGTAITVRVETPEPAPVAWVDPRQLTAALLNLTTNARDALSGGGTITVRAVPDGNRRVRVDVIDEGCGMPPEVLARAIEPFYSTKKVGHGSGLGLSMVQGFATQSGGTLAIASSPGRGTTVSLWLPAARAPT